MGLYNKVYRELYKMCHKGNIIFMTIGGMGEWDFIIRFIENIIIGYHKGNIIFMTIGGMGL